METFTTAFKQLPVGVAHLVAAATLRRHMEAVMLLHRTAVAMLLHLMAAVMLLHLTDLGMLRRHTLLHHITHRQHHHHPLTLHLLHLRMPKPMGIRDLLQVQTFVTGRQVALVDFSRAHPPEGQLIALAACSLGRDVFARQAIAPSMVSVSKGMDAVKILLAHADCLVASPRAAMLNVRAASAFVTRELAQWTEYVPLHVRRVLVLADSWVALPAIMLNARTVPAFVVKMIALGVVDACLARKWRRCGPSWHLMLQ